jgi:membrane protein DedA with SNARE-associated domain/rhodanese-related sulfurtransferase
MSQSHHAWWDLGYTGLFICVFLEQIGVPIPSFPALLAAGALVASGSLSLPGCLVTAVAAAFLADAIWYQIGRTRGDGVLTLACKMSWKPDACVTKTKIVFSRNGPRTLLVAKFIPGLSVIAPPLAGMARLAFPRFALYDLLGSLAWAIVPLLIGAYVQQSYQAFQGETRSLVPYIPWICGFLIINVLVWRYLNRKRYRTNLRQNLLEAITAPELKALLDQKQDITILDVRDEITAKAKPLTLPTARWMPYHLVAERAKELPLDKPIIVYCDCPEDQGAVAMVDLLKRNGATQARPLQGGLSHWIQAGYASEKLDAYIPVVWNGSLAETK